MKTINTKLRRHFDDQEEARKCLVWMPIGKTIRIYYGVSIRHSELVTMTAEGLQFHGKKDKKK